MIMVLVIHHMIDSNFILQRSVQCVRMLLNSECPFSAMQTQTTTSDFDTI